MNCSHCGGYGVRDLIFGVEDCPYCDGSGAERARDEKGRYTRFPTKTVENFKNGIRP
jgi:DnaJ-class molecular chaperone